MQFSKARLDAGSKSLRALDISSIPAEVDRSLLANLVFADELSQHQAYGELMQALTGSPHLEKVLNFVQAAQSAFANGMPRHCVETLLNESVLERFFRNSGSKCDYAEATDLYYTDLESADFDEAEKSLKDAINKLEDDLLGVEMKL